MCDVSACYEVGDEGILALCQSSYIPRNEASVSHQFRKRRAKASPLRSLKIASLPKLTNVAVSAIKNLANLSKTKGVLQKHRNQLDQWISRTNDPGPETLKTYILETEDQMSSTGNKISRENYRRNTEIYKRWIKTNE